jgi:hypothetical protein
MMLLRRPSAVLPVAACPGQPAQAQQYPTQDIRFTRAFPASIGGDLMPHSGGRTPVDAGDTVSFQDLSIFTNIPFVIPGSHVMRV